MQAQKESSFPTESPTECKYATGFFLNFISTKLRHVTSVDFSTSLLFTNNENDAQKWCNIHMDIL